MESNVIRTEELVKIYKSSKVVNKASIDVHKGEIVGLLGPNGAGKTTSFYMIVGLIRPASGHIYLNDENITEFPMYKRAQMGISYLPQEASVFRDLTVEKNIMAILEFSHLNRAEQKDKLEELIDEFNLHKVRKNKGKNLSGGERRRTEIARCLASDPKFILHSARRHRPPHRHRRRTRRRRLRQDRLSRQEFRTAERIRQNIQLKDSSKQRQTAVFQTDHPYIQHL